MQKIGVGGFVLVIAFNLSLPVHAATQSLCLTLLQYNEAGASIKDMAAVQSALPSLEGNAQIAGTFENWLQMADSRPDLVASAYARLLDAVAQKEVSKKDAVTALADNFENILRVTAVESSYLYLHLKLFKLLETSLDLDSFDKIASVYLRVKAKINHVEQQIFLDRIEQILIAHGYKDKFYTYLNLGTGFKYLAARKWERLRSERVADLESSYGDEFASAMLSQRSFSAQLSHHIAQWKANLNTTALIELLDDDPFTSSYLSGQIQKEIHTLADPEHKTTLPALAPDFSTRMALKNITRIFMLQKAEFVRGKNLDPFFSYFNDPSAPRQGSIDFMNQVSIEWAAFVNLAIAWERIIEWNLSSKSRWALSEEKLLLQAKGVPDFIFHFVYQETRSPRLRSFMGRLEELR